MPDQPRLIADVSPETAQDQADREEYQQRLRQYLQDGDLHRIDGFPIANDEAILALSDPPHYTACPNPFLPEILERWQEERRWLRAELGLADDANSRLVSRDSYHREPFAADVSEGKNDPIYNAHSYHTKVPHKAVMRYILHYTDPGDIVFDGFCGTGMTGVAAQICGDQKAVESLGYRVLKDGTILDEKGGPPSRLGVRKAVLVDLCPAATFIACNYNAPVDVTAFGREAERILEEVKQECGWMYQTWHPDCGASNRVKGRINYTVWSDVFVCPQCGGELVFWEVAVDREARKVRKEFPCPQCGAIHTKRTLDRAWKTVYDRVLKQPVHRGKRVPVLIIYSVGRKRHEKVPDAEDLALIGRIEESDIPYWFPTEPMMFKGEEWGDTWRAGYHADITHVQHFYTWRNLWVLAALNSRCHTKRLAVVLQSICATLCSRLTRYNLGRRGNGPLTGTLYVSSLNAESNAIRAFERKVNNFAHAFATQIDSCCVTTHSATALPQMSNDTFDYVFVDPPFGGNLMYSELNFLWEAWLRVFTNNELEAVVNKAQRKGLPEYQGLMEACFAEFYRILKPGRWMTVEFHNSQNRVWHAIQEALQRAGFVVADVRTLDKQQSTFKQVTGTRAVRQDLIISAYKPNRGLEERFRLKAGTESGAWDFVQYHLGRLPIPALEDSMLAVLAERQDYFLYDRMIAFHVQRGVSVPLSAAEFYAGLKERFSEREGMFFLPEQAAEYDRRRLQAEELVQLPLIVTDEKSAIRWLRIELGQEPRTLGDLQPLFMREAQRAWEKNEKPLELRQLLEENFLEDEQGRWYSPDPNKSQDLEKLRERALLREFRHYAGGGGALRLFRKEAVLAGFRRAWRDRDYATIVHVARRLPLRALQEDPAVLMYYDNAMGKIE